MESPTGEEITLGEPHWYVTAKRDQFPETTGVSIEVDHYVFPDTDALAAWFEEEAEPAR